MDKHQIINRLTQLASERGGHVSIRAFSEATGIPQRWLRDQLWFESWNALLQEIGMETKSFLINKIHPKQIAEAVADLIIRSGKWPTEDELRREKNQSKSFPSVSVISPIRKTGELAHLIIELGISRPELAAAAEVAKKIKLKMSLISDSTKRSRATSICSDRGDATKLESPLIHHAGSEKFDWNCQMKKIKFMLLRLMILQELRPTGIEGLLRNGCGILNSSRSPAKTFVRSSVASISSFKLHTLRPNNSFKPTLHRGVGHVPALR